MFALRALLPLVAMAYHTPQASLVDRAEIAVYDRPAFSDRGLALRALDGGPANRKRFIRSRRAARAAKAHRKMLRAKSR
jgi:hypothetical protein